MEGVLLRAAAAANLHAAMDACQAWGSALQWVLGVFRARGAGILVGHQLAGQQHEHVPLPCSTCAGMLGFGVYVYGVSLYFMVLNVD
jgi:hypothetical protein